MTVQEGNAPQKSDRFQSSLYQNRSARLKSLVIVKNIPLFITEDTLLLELSMILRDKIYSHFSTGCSR